MTEVWSLESRMISFRLLKKVANLKVPQKIRLQLQLNLSSTVLCWKSIKKHYMIHSLLLIQLKMSLRSRKIYRKEFTFKYTNLNTFFNLMKNFIILQLGSNIDKCINLRRVNEFNLIRLQHKTYTWNKIKRVFFKKPHTFYDRSTLKDFEWWRESWTNKSHRFSWSWKSKSKWCIWWITRRSYSNKLIAFKSRKCHSFSYKWKRPHSIQRF